jgi:hypothetical protein
LEDNVLSSGIIRSQKSSERTSGLLQILFTHFENFNRGKIHVLHQDSSRNVEREFKGMLKEIMKNAALGSMHRKMCTKYEPFGQRYIATQAKFISKFQRQWKCLCFVLNIA